MLKNRDSRGCLIVESNDKILDYLEEIIQECEEEYVEEVIKKRKSRLKRELLSVKEDLKKYIINKEKINSISNVIESMEAGLMKSLFYKYKNKFQREETKWIENYNDYETFKN